MLLLTLLLAAVHPVDRSARSLYCAPSGQVFVLHGEGFSPVPEAAAATRTLSASDPVVAGAVVRRGEGTVLVNTSGAVRPLETMAWDGDMSASLSPDLAFMVYTRRGEGGTWVSRAPFGPDAATGGLPNIAIAVDDLVWLDARTALVSRYNRVYRMRMREEGGTPMTFDGAWTLDDLSALVAAGPDGTGWVAEQVDEQIHLYTLRGREGLRHRYTIDTSAMLFPPLVRSLEIVGDQPVLLIGEGRVLVPTRGAPHVVELDLPAGGFVEDFCARGEGDALELLSLVRVGHDTLVHVQQAQLGRETRFKAAPDREIVVIQPR
ncbi:MAG: hypothetical protein H6740_08005 [Alphaproteobacteria bacterium]|nr:hypothetical protein [Alphaproteobacteria bacterium]